ncbi:MAG: tetraacyldisaccharide 4'-kinase [Cyclobacteriaceae bacterium]|nr:tetraacyldisaccharide 4'-kinase [Cyclobacteriaceae bacterium]
MIVLRVLLFPFAVLYDLVTRVRNKLYDLGLKPTARFEVPVISVGNLAIGGTGKTPVVEHLIRLLHADYEVATLSRGYGRNTKGFRIGNDEDSALTLGDEPFQLYRKFNDKALITVGEERAFAIPNIMDQFPNTGVVVMDDAFQHRKVTPLINLLLTDFNRPFYHDVLLPAGRLRESRKGANRADAVVVTKCPVEISDDTMMDIEKAIRKYCDKPVFFSKIHYGNPLPFRQTAQGMGEKVILVSGLANASPLVTYMKKNFAVIHHLDFPDHHIYTRNDLNKIRKLAEAVPDCSIVTTEKDAAKLDVASFEVLTAGLPFFYLPIEIEFIKSGQDFDEMVLNAIQRVQ